jgi:hypothetical protein
MHTLSDDEQSFTIADEHGVETVEKHPVVVSLADREGVFAHSMKCLRCQLEFVVFSWQELRHGNGRSHCPECGGDEFVHFVRVLTRRRTYALAHDEIAACWPFGGLLGNALVEL